MHKKKVEEVSSGPRADNKNGHKITENINKSKQYIQNKVKKKIKNSKCT